jgi:hypothetical protein
MAEEKKQAPVAAPAEVVGAAKAKKSEVKKESRPAKPWLDEIIKAKKEKK